MVKNIPTIERSTKIRFGKHAEDNQAENTIVFNASNAAITASSPGGVYMTPLRQASVGGATFLGYDAITKEIVDTNVLTTLLGGISLDEASKQGNIVSNTIPHFANVLTAFTTRYGSNVGIANTSPIHALDIGENLHITRHGNVITSGKITAGQFYGDGGTLSNIQVGLDDVIVYSNTAASKTVEFNYANGPSLITAGKVGISNANPTHTLDVGSNLYVEDTAANVLNVTGNVNVSNYLKTNKLEVSSLEIDAVTAGTVSSNIIGDNVNVNTITTNVVSLNSISPGDLLVGPSSGTVLDKLAAYTGPSSLSGPAAMSSNSSGGNTASSSGPSAIQANAWKAFDGSDSTSFICREFDYQHFGTYAYWGGTTLGGVNGEWVKIQFASAITPTSVFVKSQPDGTDSAGRPQQWRILASNDDATWTQLHSSTTVVDDSSGTTESFTNTTAYTYFAFIVTHINTNNGKWNLSRLLFNYTGSGPSEKFLRSSAAGVSWDAVSSTLQTITDGGASTNNEISFTNGVTSLTASGNVVVTGNVTASTIKSTGLTSGKIPYTNADKELIDSKVSFNTTTNVTSVSSNLVVTGNLTVQGDTVYQDTDVHTITDPIIELGNANAIDTIDMGIIMTRPTANVAAGYRGDEKEYTIAYTLSDPDGSHIVPTNATSDGYITANVWGNVVAGNVTTSGKVTADTFHGDGSAITNLDLGDATNTGQVAIARGGTGVTTGLTVLDPANLSSQVLLAKGGTGLTTVAENDLLLGPASGTALSKLSAYTQATSSSPAAMNSNLVGGVGAASSGDGSNHAYRAFDGSDSTHYLSPVTYSSTSPYGYTGNKNLGGVNGEWVIVELASSITPISVFVKSRPNGSVDFASRPNAWRIMGSNNGTNWTQLHASTTLIDDSSGTTESFNNTAAYLYLGIVVTNIAAPFANDARWTLSRLSFNYLSGPTEKFLKSSAAGISWDSVSSTLQAITDGGATTTQTVAFNNTTTGLTSAGDIDIAATKQIDYAGDVLIKSSAGAIASLKVDNAIKLDPNHASPTNNVLSFNTSTGEIYDSGGQGGSSFTNIREEGSNVSIGPTAASANLEVNTYGSNVLTVSGNVSAENITIGGLHVAVSPFNFDDVVSASTGANVTSNVITVGGLVTSGNVEADNITVTGNATSQNIKLTNTDISAAISSGTITIDAREKSYGTAPLVTSTDDVSNLVFSNLISGSQIVVPILASGGTIKISKELTNVNFYAMTTDVSVNQDKHALMTLSNVSGNIYMNALAFA